MGAPEMKIATCHPSRKAQARGLCKSCYDKWLKSVNPAYKAEQISNSTKWARKNPEKIKLILERRALKYKSDPDYRLKQRNRQLKRYGLTNDSYEALLEKQNNCCALCHRKPEKTRFHVDHDHAKGPTAVRGILCHQCNWYLGVIDSDPEIIERIKNYLGKIA